MTLRLLLMLQLAESRASWPTSPDAIHGHGTPQRICWNPYAYLGLTDVSQSGTVLFGAMMWLTGSLDVAGGLGETITLDPLLRQSAKAAAAGSHSQLRSVSSSWPCQ